jgi:origin recognition complex subunit 2
MASYSGQDNGDEDFGLYASPSRIRQYDDDDDDDNNNYDRDDYNEDEEFGVAEEDPEDDVDNELDEDGDDMDGVVRTPSRTGRGGRGRSDSMATNGSPLMTPSRRKLGTPASGRGRKTPKKRPVAELQATWLQNMMNPETEGYIKPTAADAYFVAAARPKRKRLVEVEQLEADTAEERDDDAMKQSSKKPAFGTPGGKKGKGKASENARPTRATIESSLRTHNRSKMTEWRDLLQSGFNLICHGYGSKRSLLDEFADSYLSPQGHVIVAHGLYPGLTIKDVLVEVEETFPMIRQTPVPEQAGLTRAIDKLAYRIYSYFLPPSIFIEPSSFKVAEKPLFLVLHNIDGPGLRTERSLSLLSLLASCPRIHLVTSFDHVHTPILFSTSQNIAGKHRYAAASWDGVIPSARGFAWAWIDSPTYSLYDLEMQYVRQTAAITGKGFTGMDVNDVDGQHGEVTEEGVLRILQSVPPMARRLFKLLALRQLAALPADTKSSRAYPLANAQTAPVFAMDSDILQKLAKDRFIAREEERFTSQLAEYKDHGVIVEHILDPENRAGRWLWIPLSKDVLTRVLATMEDVEA